MCLFHDVMLDIIMLVDDMCLFQDVILDITMVVDDKLFLVLFSFRVLFKETFKYIQTYPNRGGNVISEDIMLIGSYICHLVQIISPKNLFVVLHSRTSGMRFQ